MEQKAERYVAPGKLKLWRKYLGLTIPKMAELCDVSGSTWTCWESGERSIPRATAIYIALHISWPVDIPHVIPTSEEIKALRVSRDQSQIQASGSVDYGVDKWKSWEAGKPMPRIVWHIYRLGGIEAAKQHALRVWKADEEQQKMNSDNMGRYRNCHRIRVHHYLNRSRKNGI